MSDTLEKYAPFLRELQRASNDRVRRAMLRENMDDEFIHCVTECATNVLKGKVPLTSDQKKKLARRKHSLREISSKKTSYKRKRDIIQSGGFIGALLTPIISILGGLLGGLGGRS
jgi:hypothetical protein